MNDRQAVFCQEYMVDLNATQAAIRAGYSAKTANKSAWRVMARDDVRREIQRLMGERSDRTRVSADRVLLELARIAFVNPTDVLSVVDSSVKAGMSPDDAAVIAGIKVKISPAKDGEHIEREVRLHDKVKALELLGRHLNLFGDRVRLEGPVPVVITGGDELED